MASLTTKSLAAPTDQVVTVDDLLREHLAKAYFCCGLPLDGVCRVVVELLRSRGGSKR